MREYFVNATLITIGSLCLLGCGSGSKYPLATTTGRVVCEGQPVPFVTVFFEPISSAKGTTYAGKSGLGFADAGGKFVISTYKRDSGDGAVIAKHRVRVDYPPPAESKGFKCDCVLGSEIDAAEVEVVSGKSNDFEIKLKKATTKQSKQMNSELQERAADAEQT